MRRLISLGFLLAVVVIPLVAARDGSLSRGLRHTIVGFLAAGVTYALLVALLLPGVS